MKQRSPPVTVFFSSLFSLLVYAYESRSSAVTLGPIITLQSLHLDPAAPGLNSDSERSGSEAGEQSWGRGLGEPGWRICPHWGWSRFCPSSVTPLGDKVRHMSSPFTVSQSTHSVSIQSLMGSSEMWPKPQRLPVMKSKCKKHGASVTHGCIWIQEEPVITMEEVFNSFNSILFIYRQ